jgi:outer membrane protein OmpA-like peptidoglycan-associated protein
MTATRQIVRLGFLAGLLAGAASAQAGEAVIFSGPAPQAAELARILWPGKQRAATLGATRSIRINSDLTPAAPAAAPPAAHVQVAEAEPVVTSDAAPTPEAPDAVADAFGFPINFAFDSTEILPESRPYLDSVGAMLGLPEAKDKRIVIVGHTDAVGSEQYNQALSERRAATVRAYLETQFGVAVDRLEIEGQGETTSLTDTDPYAPQNRRVEFHAAG